MSTSTKPKKRVLTYDLDLLFPSFDSIYEFYDKERKNRSWCDQNWSQNLYFPANSEKSKELKKMLEELGDCLSKNEVQKIKVNLVTGATSYFTSNKWVHFIDEVSKMDIEKMRERFTQEHGFKEIGSKDTNILKFKKE